MLSDAIIIIYRFMEKEATSCVYFWTLFILLSHLCLTARLCGTIVDQQNKDHQNSVNNK